LDDLVVDARGLEPPQPMERILEALTILQGGQRLRFLMHREPFPLYRLLQRNGYQWRTERSSAGDFEIVIWEPAPASPETT
jgi:uncharacterized protein (DUF2249 family)